MSIRGPGSEENSSNHVGCCPNAANPYECCGFIVDFILAIARIACCAYLQERESGGEGGWGSKIYQSDVAYQLAHIDHHCVLDELRRQRPAL